MQTVGYDAAQLPTRDAVDVAGGEGGVMIVVVVVLVVLVVELVCGGGDGAVQ
jgi:hypothetical protein